MTIKLNTIVNIQPSANKITHQKYVLLFGSCFSEHIGDKLKAYHFNVCSNPTGVLYNPSSIISAINRVISERPYTRSEIFLHQQLWRSWDHHSRFSSPDPDDTLSMMNKQLEVAINHLKNIDFLFLTPGTSSVYRNCETGKIVANCHKFPHCTFSQELLSPELIIQQFSTLFDELLKKHPSLTIAFTLSPVRYINDSLHKNQVSKSYLMTAIYELEKRYPQVYYFPAYEIMMDELRDYRFYNQDLIHPNETAISIIWERFQQSFFTERVISFIKDYAPVLLSYGHRIQFRDLDSTRTFANSILSILEKLCQKYPDINLDNDFDYFKSLL